MGLHGKGETMSRWSKVHWSSDSGEWTTPKELFAEIDKEFHFTLDAAASKGNALCKRYWTKEDDALAKDWGGRQVIWCNPPYGRGLDKWLACGYRGSQPYSAGRSVIVFLLPARTDTQWFYEYATQPRAEVRFLKGRLKFGGSENSAPFPSMLLIFRPVRKI